MSCFILIPLRSCFTICWAVRTVWSLINLKKTSNYIHKLAWLKNLTLMVKWRAQCASKFLRRLFLHKKGSGGSWLFVIHYKLSENHFFVFHSVLGNLKGAAGTLFPRTHTTFKSPTPLGLRCSNNKMTPFSIGPS